MNGLYKYSRVVVFFAFCLIVAGGLVTSTGSGLSVPDWPLSYGKVFPPMIGGIRFEHSHRVIAGFVGILTFILTALTFRFEKRKWVKVLALLASLSVIAQAVLGGITVIYLLPLAVSAAHACLGQTFFTLLCIIAWCLSPGFKEAKKITSEKINSLRRLLTVTTFFIYCQLIAGSIVRHNAGQGINYHFVLALLIFLHTLFIVFRIIRDQQLQKLTTQAFLFMVLIFIQIFLGLITYFLKFHLKVSDSQPHNAEILFATAHQATGALILAAVALLTFRAFHQFKSSAKS